jgi:hypothetical protein
MSCEICQKTFTQKGLEKHKSRKRPCKAPPEIKLEQDVVVDADTDADTVGAPILTVVSPQLKLIHGDCLIEMTKLPNASIDMVLCDLPYGVTRNSWDVVIPFDALWKEYKRVVKENGAIVLFGSQPFT